MKPFSRPKIVVSKCIEFEACRYNGDIIHSQTVAELKKYVDFIPVCPEVEIGMGVPRMSVRIVDVDGEKKLVAGKTGEDFTEKMREFANSFIEKYKKNDFDGFILKTSSPSCGYKDARVYTAVEGGSSIRKNYSGFFAEAVESQFQGKIFETEGRLENFNIREDFYTKIFIAASFRDLKENMKINELVDFHSRNKYLLMSYSSSALKKMGNTAANRENKGVAVIFEEYEKELSNAVNKKRKPGTNINVLLHLMGYFSNKITKEEKEFFLEKVEQYKKQMIPLSVPLSLIEMWAIRFNEDYLCRQTILNPFPKELISVTDSGKGREIK